MASLVWWKNGKSRSTRENVALHPPWPTPQGGKNTEKGSQTEQGGGVGGRWSTGLALLAPILRAISLRLFRGRILALPDVAGVAKEAAT